MEAPPVDRELWAEYAVGALVILVRFAVRAKVIGVRNFNIEDALMVVALITYSAITTMIHLITRHGATIGQTAESVYLLPDEVVANMVIGQKLTFVDWYVYLIYVWALKAVLLAIFRKLAQGLPRETLVWKAVVAYTILCFFGAAIAHTCCCLPVHHSWQVRPYPGGEFYPSLRLTRLVLNPFLDRCALRDLNYYIVTFFNASSDVAIIAIPIPIIFRAKISIWRRLSLLFLLCSGAFVVVCAILRAYYSLQDLTLLPIASGWTSRETFVAAVVVSIPGIKPMFSRKTWFKFRSTNPSSNDDGGSRRLRTHELVTIGGSGNPGSQLNHEWTVNGKEHKGARLSSDGSEDIILRNEGIQVTNSYEVREDRTSSK